MINNESSGNDTTLDNGQSYSASARGSFSAAFKDIANAEQLVEYLNDAPRRLENSKYIHHYTTLSSAIAIMTNRKWHLANAKNMNDQLEYANGDLNRWPNIFFSSFMTEDKESIGMWSMYSQPWEKGVKLSIPAKVARDWISSISTIQEISTSNYQPTERKVIIQKNAVRLASIAYCHTDSELKSESDHRISWSNVSNNRLENIVHNKILTGYMKDQAWSYEKEIRIFAEFNNPLGFDRIAIDLPDEVLNSMTITASPLFEGSLADLLPGEIQQAVRIEKSFFTGRLNIRTICQTCDLKNPARPRHGDQAGDPAEGV